MLGSEVLEVAAGLAFLFLALSLIATAVREQIEALLKTRAIHLERGLRQMLADPAGADITKALFDHPLLDGLFRGQYDPSKLTRFWIPRSPLASGAKAKRISFFSRMPAYIPSRNFAMALLDIASGHTAPGAPTIDLKNVQATVATLTNTKLARALQVAVGEAKGDVDRARASLEAWFDSTMDRVSGLYKRESQLILLVIGLVLAVSLNIDAVRVGYALSTNNSFRQSVVANIEQNQAKLKEEAEREQTAQPPSQPSPKSTTLPNVAGGGASDSEKVNRINAQGLDGFATAIGWRSFWLKIDDDFKSANHNWEKARATVTQQYDTAALKQAALMQAASRRAALKQWDHDHPKPMRKKLEFWAFVWAIIGWILTAIAVGVGAPFWFDMLNKIMIIRSTVKPFEKSPNEGSGDRKGGVPPASRLEVDPSRADPAVTAGTQASPPVAGMGPEFATVRLAIDEFSSFPRDFVTMLVNDETVEIPPDGMVELPLKIGATQVIKVSGTLDGKTMNWEESLVPRPEHDALPYTISLRDH